MSLFCVIKSSATSNLIFFTNYFFVRFRVQRVKDSVWHGITLHWITFAPRIILLFYTLCLGWKSTNLVGPRRHRRRRGSKISPLSPQLVFGWSLGWAQPYLNNNKAVNLKKKEPPDGTEFRFKSLIRQKHLQFWSIIRVYYIWNKWWMKMNCP